MKNEHHTSKLGIFWLLLCFLCGGAHSAALEDVPPGKVRIVFFPLEKEQEVCSGTYDMSERLFFGSYQIYSRHAQGGEKCRASIPVSDTYCLAKKDPNVVVPELEDFRCSRMGFIQPLEDVFADRLLMGYVLKQEFHQHPKISKASFRLGDAALDYYERCDFFSEVMSDLLVGVLSELSPCAESNLTAVKLLRQFPLRTSTRWSVAQSDVVLEEDISRPQVVVVVGGVGILRGVPGACEGSAKIGRSLLFAKIQGARESIFSQYAYSDAKCALCINQKECLCGEQILNA